MPTYEYACRDCGTHVEVVQSFTDEPLTTCATCGGSVRKVFSAVGITFKGSGFYKTDSRKTGAGSAGASTASGDATSAPSTSESSGKGSSGAAGTGSSDSGGTGSGSTAPAAAPASSGSSGDKAKSA